MSPFACSRRDSPTSCSGTCSPGPSASSRCATISSVSARRAARPTSPGHRLISYGEQLPKPFGGVNWLLERAREDTPDLEPAFTVNNTYGILRAVETGIGLASLPAFLAQQNPTLVRVLHDIESPRVDAYFVYPEEMRGSQRVVAFRDFLLRKIARTQF